MVSLTSLNFYSHQDLLDRLSDTVLSGGREIVFLVGSPLVAPVAPGDGGVPNVDGVINLIRSQFGTKVKTLTELNEAVRRAPQFKYQEAFKFLLGKRSQDVANGVIRRAVLHAHKNLPALLAAPHLPSDSECAVLEQANSDWHLPSAVHHFGQLIARYPSKCGQRILTSNFDPLIEIAIARAGGTHYRTVLSGDGGLTDTHAAGCKVVHFHGYWYGSDTLHTPLQLKQPRPHLRKSLSNLLEDCTVVVLAYGGWDDIFTEALINVIGDHSASPDVIWSFYESNEKAIHKHSKHVLERLRPGIYRSRVTLFKGIDCHALFRDLVSTLEEQSKSPGLVSEAENRSQAMHSVVTSRDASKPDSLKRGPSYVPAGVKQQLSDSPPRVDVWVGRKNEFDTLVGTESPVVLITGIGGQGKSALAAKYVQYAGQRPDLFELWDWRDCREEGDRFNTQLTAVIERLSVGSVRASDLEGQDSDALTDVLFHVLASRRCLLVFDNVDHYIDFQELKPISGLAVLLEKALKRPHSSRFVFTCRPNIGIADPGAQPIYLKDGLSESETLDLFRRRGVRVDGNEKGIQDTHILTAGHPLWLNLIAVQVAGNLTTLPQILAAIRKGQRDVAANPLDPIWTTLRENQKIILDPIWATLKDKQKSILRTMAEMVRAGTVEKLGEYVRNRMHYAQFVKQTKTLIALNLIVVKPRSGTTDLVDLHPIIREYIRDRFPKAEQEPFIAAIIIVVDGYIRQFTSRLTGEPSFDMLGYWTEKVELNLNRRDYSAAIATLHDVSRHLIAGGYPEEFIRVARKVFDSIDWSKEFSAPSEIDNLFADFVSVLIQFGERSEAETYLDRYERAIPGKSGQYVNACNLRCYLYWYAKEFANAIVWGERGEHLKASSNADTRFSCTHNLALARRDSGLCEIALAHFAGSVPLQTLVDPGALDQSKHASFYGNIGRCLHLMGRHEDALACYRKSARLLEKEAPEPNHRLNMGYARLWIGEAYLDKGEHAIAALFLRAAVSTWEAVSPPRAADANGRLSALQSDGDPLLANVFALESSQVESECKRWILGKDFQIKMK